MRARLAFSACLAVLVVVLIGHLAGDPWKTAGGGAILIFSFLVLAYVASRLTLSQIYRSATDQGLEPTVAVIVPAFNEERAIAGTLESILASDYDPRKLSVVAVDDGSSDSTRGEIERVVAAHPGRVKLVAFDENQGKRVALARGLKACQSEIVALVDSDSQVEPDALRRLVQGFAEPEVGGICGLIEVANLRASWVTRMQAVWYCWSFEVEKAAESVLGNVTCCPGCFSAYRREAISSYLETWLHGKRNELSIQTGEDRALTNFVLRGWKTRYQRAAVCHTLVPDNFSTFLRQQLRWKRGWARGAPVIASFIWRKKNPFVPLTVYLQLALALLAPIAVAQAVVWRPLVLHGGLHYAYLATFVLTGSMYFLFFLGRKPHLASVALFGVVFVTFELVILYWLTYYAITTVRYAGWGTRSTSRDRQTRSQRAAMHTRTASVFAAVTAPVFLVAAVMSHRPLAVARPLPVAQQRAITRVLAYTPYVSAGGAARREVALTFDDGPSRPYTPSVLRILRREHAAATFFDVGRMALAHPELSAAEASDGFPVGDHTEDHLLLTAVSTARQRAQLVDAANAIQAAGDPYPLLFRPPYGAFDSRTLRALAKLHMLTVMWSVSTEDWRRPGVTAIVDRALRVRAGGIILMHDGGGDRSQTVAALPIIIRVLRARGLRLVTVPQLLLDSPPPRHQKLPPGAGSLASER